MAIETERFQVVLSEADGTDGAIAVLLDTATGRTWFCGGFAGEGGAIWQPMAFAADAAAAPIPAKPRKPTRKPRRARA